MFATDVISRQQFCTKNHLFPYFVSTISEGSNETGDAQGPRSLAACHCDKYLSLVYWLNGYREIFLVFSWVENGPISNGQEFR